MPPKTVSFYLSADALKVLDDRESDRASGGRSGALELILGRYAEICRRDLPDLSSGEWSLCADALNGVMFRDPFTPHLLWANVDDAIKFGSLDKKWNVDGPALVQKVRALRFGATIALLDEVERYWLDPSDKVLGQKEPGRKAKL